MRTIIHILSFWEMTNHLWLDF